MRAGSKISAQVVGGVVAMSGEVGFQDLRAALAYVRGGVRGEVVVGLDLGRGVEEVVEEVFPFAEACLRLEGMVCDVVILLLWGWW